MKEKVKEKEKMSTEKEAKLKALQLTLDKLDKTYGKGTVMKMGDKAIVEVETISSGSLGIDLALGVNGYPRGRIIEIYGPESSGKTTLTLHAIAEAQKAGGSLCCKRDSAGPERMGTGRGTGKRGRSRGRG